MGNALSKESRMKRLLWSIPVLSFIAPAFADVHYMHNKWPVGVREHEAEAGDPASVPEPTSADLMLAGLAIMGVAVYLRRK